MTWERKNGRDADIQGSYICDKSSRRHLLAGITSASLLIQKELVPIYCVVLDEDFLWMLDEDEILQNYNRL